MKYAHYEVSTGRLLGWYSDDIHDTIPTPNKEVSDAAWQEALDGGFNHINPAGILSLRDFRTPEQIAADAQAQSVLVDDAADASEIRNTPAVKSLILARPAQIDTYIDNNVTDLASAKDVLKILAKAISAIGKKSFR